MKNMFWSTFYQIQKDIDMIKKKKKILLFLK